MDYYYYKPGDRFYYFDLKNNRKTDKMGTVVEKVYDQNIKGSNHNPYLGENKTVRLQLYAVQFDNSPGINRIGNTQMIPDYQEVREQKLNDLGIKD